MNRDRAVDQMLIYLVARDRQAGLGTFNSELLVAVSRGRGPRAAAVNSDVLRRLVRRAVENAATEERVASSPRRPGVAALHLLGYGSYVDEQGTIRDQYALVEDTGLTVAQIRMLEKGWVGPGLSLEQRGLSLRLLIAALAGGYGRSRRLLQPTYRPPHIRAVAERVVDSATALMARPALLQEIREEAERASVVVLTSIPVGTTHRPQRARPPRVRRDERRTPTVKDGARITALLFVPAAAVAVGIFSASYFAGSVEPHFQATDPIDARAKGAYWRPGIGPDAAHRERTNTSGISLAPIRLGVPLLAGLGPKYLASGRIIAGDNYRFNSIGVGRHPFKIEIYGETGDASAGELSDLTLQLGIQGARFGGSKSFWARIDSTETGPVWDGRPVTPDCDCSVSIDGLSLRLAGDGVPRGLQLGSGALSSTGQLVGFSGATGRLNVPSEVAIVTGDLVVSAVAD